MAQKYSSEKPKRWRHALKLAWGKTVSDLVGSWDRVTVSGIIAAIASVMGYFVLVREDDKGAAYELLPLLTGPAAIILIGLALFIFNWASRVPYRQWSLLDGRVSELENMIRPRISVQTTTNHRAESIDYGTTNTSLGGTRQTVITHGPNHSLRLEIINENLETLVGCEAYLTRFQDLDPNEESKYWSATRLPWLASGRERENQTNIPSSGMRSIILFRVINNRVHLVENDGVPVHMVNAIKDAGHYHGIVTVSAQNATSAFIPFELICGGSGAPPMLMVSRPSPFEEPTDIPFAREVPFVP